MSIRFFMSKWRTSLFVRSSASWFWSRGTHLALSNTGKYQLLIEVIMPDQNTGSNNMQVSALTQTFEVRYASKATGEWI